MRRRVLVTGFGPFPGVPENASGLLVPRLARAARRRFGGVEIFSSVLPTEWERGLRRALLAIERLKPDVAIHFGVSSRAAGFVIERRGVNECAVSEDGAGQLPPGAVLNKGGQRVRRASLPVQRIVGALKTMGLPAIASDDAGTYLCNAVLYQSLGLAEASGGMIAGFVHLPSTLAERGMRSGDENLPLTVEQALAGSLAIIAICLGEL